MTKERRKEGDLSVVGQSIYLHWFDKQNYRHDGPAHWAKATLVRYAGNLLRWD